MTPEFGELVRYRGRKLNPNLPVQVYRNLNHGEGVWYSIRQGGRVVGHARGLMLKDCTFIVQDSGRKRYLKTGHKNVHAWVQGYWTLPLLLSIRTRIQYKPAVFWKFYSPRTGKRVNTARYVKLGPWGITATGAYC